MIWNAYKEKNPNKIPFGLNDFVVLFTDKNTVIIKVLLKKISDLIDNYDKSKYL